MFAKIGNFLKRTWKLCLFILFIGLVIDTTPLISTKPTLAGTEANIARSKAKAFADGLASADTKINLDFDSQDINAISSTLSHMFDNTNMGLGYSPNMVQGASSTEVSLGLFSIYFNIYCEIELLDYASDKSSKIEHCKLGDLPIPGIAVSGLMYAGLTLLFDGEVASTVDNLLSNVSVKNRTLHVNAFKSIDFKERVNDTLNDASSLAKLAIQTNIPQPKIIQAYLDDIARQPKSTDMSVYIKNSMQLASLRSIDNDPVTENKAALWAWAISFGTARFARIAGITDYPKNPQVTLRGRRDLAQHFIYSAIIAQLSSTQFSARAGELKEILDSGKGGSGFSFADLLADNTGIAFGETITLNKDKALRSQVLLAKMTQKDTFFPYIHDLPEGLSENRFRLIFDNASSDSYDNFINQMNARIGALILYNDSDSELFLDIPKPRLTQNSVGRWLTVDTHIHTKYSDGAHTIAEIATNAKRFGCDAIAITDHGDKNLSGVLSDAFFDDIEIANIENTGLTVIPGLEWNIPPFNGREHATVLLPEHTNIKNQFRQFRNSFDHYGEYTRRHLTIKEGLEWLNNLAKQSPIEPVFIYNHPSRKDFSSRENKYDMSQWQRLSASVIGMSGSPGHQKKRGLDNGSYETLLKTMHGLDPVTKKGSEWDMLLQKGYRVLGARAPSDFHNTGMDYWPCEFSSTHVFSASNRHNDILQGLINGRTWAQHGKFVERLNFMILSRGNAYFAGQSIPAFALENSSLNVDIVLAEKDWQGFSTSLDKLDLIIVGNEKIQSIDLLSKANKSGETIRIDLQLALPSDTRAIRLLGRSIQAELHHYSLFTNPIVVEQ